jgi:hypothetical protein
MSIYEFRSKLCWEIKLRMQEKKKSQKKKKNYYMYVYSV